MTPRTFVEALAGEVEVTGDEHHYLFRVRRLAVGDPVIVVDGAGHEADARVAAIGPERARLEVGPARAAARPRPRLVVLQGLIKGERMEWCVEKLTEAGADAIVLVACARAVVRLDGPRAAARRDRLAARARAAARQSQRPVPAVTGPVALAEALAGAAGAGVRVVCHPAAREARLAARHAAAGEVAILIGPEGGLAPDEVEAAVAAGFAPVSLGDGVLRAETAGPLACAFLRLAAPARAADPDDPAS
jgi:16S rRNA (uracil1498-N3)-methyltransferase